MTMEISRQLTLMVPRMRACIFVSLWLGIAGAEPRFSVNGVTPGMKQNEVRALMPGSVLKPGYPGESLTMPQSLNGDFYGLLTPIRQVEFESEQATDCIGDTLEYAGKVIVRRGDSVARLKHFLGEPDRVTGAMGWCHQDPVLRYVYIRDGAPLLVTVSNDEFIRRDMPEPASHKELYGKVWVFHLAAPRKRTP
jgi:hypothetical protein